MSIFLEAPAARFPVAAARLLLALAVRGPHPTLHGRPGRGGEASHQEGRVPGDPGLAVWLWIKRDDPIMVIRGERRQRKFILKKKSKDAAVISSIVFHLKNKTFSNNE